LTPWNEECPVCQGRAPTVFLDRDRVPVQQNLLVESRRAALETPRGRLRLVVCEQCGFVFNQSFDPKLFVYDECYDNTQSCSPLFDAYLDDLVHDLVEHRNLRGSRIVEVGCGKGLFLKKLVEADAGNRGCGFDPSYRGRLSQLDDRLTFEKRYYDSSCRDTPADAVICRHVIEHVADPVGLLQTIRRTLEHSHHARLFLETPCAEWILTNGVIWDFFYEHCSYFTAASLATALTTAGFRMTVVRHVFGGQYLWVEASLAEVDKDFAVPLGPGAIPELARSFATQERARIEAWKGEVQALAKDGKVAIWGAGAKGVTFAHLIDPECQRIACVVDVNPNKQGHFVPGTGHPIISQRDMEAYQVRSALVLNPNYLGEIEASLQKAGLEIRLIDMMA
jgi:2-polyprenyl-3-methyl-5-hydroxy-6-metoxy-1,4-benzoquinol methylase